MKYAIMVLFDAEQDDWLFVTEQVENEEGLRIPQPILFNSIEEAAEHSLIWVESGKEDNVSIVIYDEEAN
jgi:hypothetical protein